MTTPTGEPVSTETPSDQDIPAPDAIAVVEEPAPLDRHECGACGYIYEPTKGDSRRKVPAGIAFEAIAEDWRCPVCGAPKRQFANIGPKGTASGFKENLGYGFGVNTLTPGQKNILIFGGLALGFLFFISLYGLR